MASRTPLRQPEPRPNPHNKQRYPRGGLERRDDVGIPRELRRARLRPIPVTITGGNTEAKEWVEGARGMEGQARPPLQLHSPRTTPFFGRMA
jgi:hypothetical protein